MKKMTLVEQAVLDRVRQKQIANEIQQPELSAKVKIRSQIEDTFNNSKLTDTEKLDILERAREIRQGRGVRAPRKDDLPGGDRS